MSRPPGRDGASGEAGFALLVAILFLLIVTSVIAPFVLAARTRFDLAADSQSKIRLDILADGLVTVLARAIAAAPDDADRLGVSLRSVPAVCRTEGLAVETRLQDQRGLVDVNTADEAMIATALQSLGLETAGANANARALVASREEAPPEDLVGPMPAPAIGVDAPDPSLLLDGVKGGPYTAIEELYDVAALQGVPLRRLAETFTVHGGDTLDPDLAPAVLAGFLPPPDPAAAAADATGDAAEAGTYRIDVFVRADADATLGYAGAVVLPAVDDAGSFTTAEHLVNPNLLPGGGTEATAIACDRLFGPEAAAALRTVVR